MLRYKCGLWGIEFQPNLNYLLICLWEKCRSLFLVMYFTKAYYTYHVSKYRLEYFAVLQYYTICSLWFFEIRLPNITYQYQVKDSSKVIKIQKFNLNLDRCTEDFVTHFIYHSRILFERWPHIKRICDLYCISWSPFIFTFLNKTVLCSI